MVALHKLFNFTKHGHTITRLQGLATLLVLLCSSQTSLLAADPLTREQIYTRGGFVKNWVAPMPSSPVVAAGSTNNTNVNISGEKFIVQNWATTFHSIQIGGNDISFVNDPFQAPFSKIATSNAPTVASPQQEIDQVLQLVYPKDSYAPSIGPVTGGTHFYATPFGDKTPFSKMMVSYDVAFPSGFNWGLGGKLPGAYGGTAYGGCSGGVQATGTNCITMRLMWRPNGAGEAYAYVPVDARSEFCKNPAVICNDLYGKSIGRGQIYFQSGTWTRLDMVMNLNEPAGASNGTLQVYQNGNLVVSIDDIPYRTTGMVGFQGLMFSSFFGGSDPSYATPVDTRVFFRNVQMSVGPPAKLYEGSGNGAAKLSQHIY
ncbi:hypothetical protein BGZ93_001943 [Podila epicladia]|nr:hypothetical protein BGZ93_001943 [Podila epicladia]